jgi:GAF domain-containing protein
MGDGMGSASQFILVMREEAPLPSLDREDRGSTRALQVLGEIAQGINATLELDATLQATLDGVHRLIPFDAAQISLWEPDQERLAPRRRSGPETYVQALAYEGQSYALDEGFAGWIARKRRPLLVPDIAIPEADAQPVSHPGDAPFNAYLGVPLLVRNRFIGALELMTREIGGFDREDQALLTLLAEQAAIAIENARQYSAQAERVTELSGLQKIAGAISVLRTPYQLFAQLGERVAELMDVDMAGVMLYDREAEKLVAQKPLFGVPDMLTADYQISLEKGSPARAVWEDVSFWFSNNVAEDRLVEALGLNMLAELTDVHTTAMAVMTVGEDRIGVLQVSNKQDGTPFTMEDIRLLQIYANQAAIVVESGRLYREEQSRVAELRGLQQITQALSSFTNPDELYAQLTERIAGLMGVDVCGVLLYDPDQEVLAARKPFFGVPDAVAENYVIALRRGPARELWREYELYESNASGHPRCGPRSGAADADVCASERGRSPLRSAASLE